MLIKEKISPYDELRDQVLSYCMESKDYGYVRSNVSYKQIYAMIEQFFHSSVVHFHDRLLSGNLSQLTGDHIVDLVNIITLSTIGELGITHLKKYRQFGYSCSAVSMESAYRLCHKMVKSVKYEYLGNFNKGLLSTMNWIIFYHYSTRQYGLTDWQDDDPRNIISIAPDKHNEDPSYKIVGSSEEEDPWLKLAIMEEVYLGPMSRYGCNGLVDALGHVIRKDDKK